MARTASARAEVAVGVGTRLPTFLEALDEHGISGLRRGAVTTLQINLGRLCNLACHHCHVEAGPARTEMMSEEVAERIVWLLEKNPGIGLVDITGGAPEMNPSFRHVVSESRRLGRDVIDRCNLTIFFEDGYEDLPEFLADQGVHIIASLPCYTADNVDQQRGRGVFNGSIEALRRLNALGYGRPDSPLRLDLVFNPLGPSLPPPQVALEAQYREELGRLFDIEFHRLLTITNMPIRRFADTLTRTGKHDQYMSLLVNQFNAGTVPGLMCRSLVSVDWNGRLFDCDFNLMLDIPIGALAATGARTVWDIDSFDAFDAQRIATASHCFGCTAGAGSSCGGALA